MTQPPIVLASSSPFRRALLERLEVPFSFVSPAVDETRRPDEQAERLVVRLAEAKARAVATEHPGALIIGSDQVACIDGAVLGKPGNRERAIDQLSRASGRVVTFYTGLCLLNTGTGMAPTRCERFRVHFRALSPQQIAGYVDLERPFDCAGSFKSEGLGIALFERLEGDDPSTLIGLPLIRLVRMLEAEGLDVLRARVAEGRDHWDRTAQQIRRDSDCT